MTNLHLLYPVTVRPAGRDPTLIRPPYFSVKPAFSAVVRIPLCYLGLFEWTLNFSFVICVQPAGRFKRSPRAEALVRGRTCGVTCIQLEAVRSARGGWLLLLD